MPFELDGLRILFFSIGFGSDFSRGNFLFFPKLEKFDDLLITLSLSINKHKLSIKKLQSKREKDADGQKDKQRKDKQKS